jgi:hypothetical protein
MVFANVVLHKWGSKWTITLGLTVYCIYTASFLIVNYTTGPVEKFFVRPLWVGDHHIIDLP